MRGCCWGAEDGGVVDTHTGVARPSARCPHHWRGPRTPQSPPTPHHAAWTVTSALHEGYIDIL